MSTDASQMIAWLRAAGEPSRLRLLALCDQGDLSVSDLAQALGQSEPRVCRHLRILSESGLIERLRNGQWVHYQLTSDALGASFVKGLLAQLDRRDPVFARDLDRALTDIGPEGAVAARLAQPRLGRALRDFVQASAPSNRFNAVLVIGVEHLELLESAAAVATHCTAIAQTRRAAQAARAFAERRGFRCRVLLTAGSADICERDVARAGGHFDAVIVNHVGAPPGRFEHWIETARSALAPQGTMWLFESYESLELARDKVVEHPLARMRRLVGELGLRCEQLSPIESDNQHVLAAVAAAATIQEHARRA